MKRIANCVSVHRLTVDLKYMAGVMMLLTLESF